LSISNIAVIIIAKNESKSIESCLVSIFNQSVKPLEVIVVDGRSTDDTVEKARKFPVKILIESGNTSPSNARNLGVHNANSDIVLVMGADAELDQDCIKNAIKYFEDPNVIVVIPTLQIRIHNRLEEIQRDWFWGTRSRIRTPRGTGSSIQFVRKEVYLKVKFDTKIGFGDDSDFRRRMKKMYEGRPEKIIKVADSKILVDLPHSISEMAEQYMWYGRTSLRYYLRYHTWDAILRLGSMLMPSIFFFSFIVTLAIPKFIYITIMLFALVIIRNLTICIRSGKSNFIEFMLFDLLRSFLYVVGVFQSIFVKRIGR